MLYTPEFREQLERVYFLQRVKLFYIKIDSKKQDPCEHSKHGHQYEKYSPHLGCVKMVCRFCAQEKPNHQLFVPSVNSFKGRTFQFKKKDFSHAPSDYRCA